MGKQTLRKHLSRKVEGNKEIIENEIYELEDFLTNKELEVICDMHGGDPEAAFGYGVVFGDDDLVWIAIDLFCEWAEDWLNDQEEDSDEAPAGDDFEAITKIKEKLEKYRTFDISFDG